MPAPAKSVCLYNSRKNPRPSSKTRGRTRTRPGIPTCPNSKGIRHLLIGHHLEISAVGVFLVHIGGLLKFLFIDIAQLVGDLLNAGHFEALPPFDGRDEL